MEVLKVGIGIILTSIFLLALIDPFDKLLVVDFLKDLFEHKTVAKSITLGNALAFVFGATLIIGGEALINNVLHLSVSFLQFLGGVILIFLSTYALWKLYRKTPTTLQPQGDSPDTTPNDPPKENNSKKDKKNIENVEKEVKKVVNPYVFAIFPLAVPLILGPAIITTTLTISVQKSVIFAITSYGLAVGLNFLIMLWALKFMRKIDEKKIKPYLTAIAIFVLVVGVKMTLDGLIGWAL
jgi:small neutral amino acid transporter SnatA (MarC family)